MDTGIVDTINRRWAALFAAHLDSIDTGLGFTRQPWHTSPIAASLMGENDATDADRAWLVGSLSACAADLDIEGCPADADWENLFSHIRAEILARRESGNPTSRVSEIEPSQVV